MYYCEETANEIIMTLMFKILQTWPEALTFNADAGCFEVVTDSKRKLAEEIKAAVRAGKPRKAIYKPVTKNSFSTIPLIPLEDEPQPVLEIKTSFTVKVGYTILSSRQKVLSSAIFLKFSLSHIVP